MGADYRVHMLKFLVFDDDCMNKGFPLHQSYLIGSDNNALRANITFKDGLIACQKREPGVAAMALLYDAGASGQLVLQTCLLPEREDPYILSLELARHRLLSIYNKLEDWSMFEVGPDQSVMQRFEAARRQFVKALCYQKDDQLQADQLAKTCLAESIEAGEALTLDRAESLLVRRVANGMIPKYPIGCRVSVSEQAEDIGGDLLKRFNIFYLPTPWREIVPQEGQYRWGNVDRWSTWFARQRVPVIAGPIVSFEKADLPDWLFAGDLEYPAIRDQIYEHTQRVVSRYRSVVKVWNVISDLHVNSHFGFNFEQLMELSRMTTMLVKKIQPASRTLVEISQPFGEYYATNQRSIPPLMYADLLMQSAIAFDGFVIKLLMGQSGNGQKTRDLMQISHLLDQFGVYGKPVTLVVAVPSGPPPSAKASRGGYWHSLWSQSVQARWLEAIFNIAISKPSVEFVMWYQWRDCTDAELPQAGLIDSHCQPKIAFHKLEAVQSRFLEAPGHMRSGSSLTEG